MYQVVESILVLSFYAICLIQKVMGLKDARIAICDDNIHFLEQIHRLTQASLMRFEDSLKSIVDSYNDRIHLKVFWSMSQKSLKIL